MVVLKPSAIDPDALGRPAIVPRYGPELHPKLAGLLIGGNAGPFRYRREEWERLLAFIAAGLARLGDALARLDLAPHAGFRRRPDRRARQGRERGRPLHRLPHGGARHVAGGLRQGRGDRLHRRFEHDDLGGRLGAAARGRRGAHRPSLHRRGAELSDFPHPQQLVPRAADRRAYAGQVRRARCPRSSRSARTRSMRSPPS